jgi:hypothetical protein
MLWLFHRSQWLGPRIDGEKSRDVTTAIKLRQRSRGLALRPFYHF